MFLHVRYAGKVKSFDKTTGCLVAHFYNGSPARSLTQKLRPWTKKDSHVLVELEDVFLTFEALTLRGQLPKDVRAKVSRWVEDTRAGEKHEIVASFAGCGDDEEDDALQCLVAEGKGRKGRKKKKKKGGVDTGIGGKRRAEDDDGCNGKRRNKEGAS